MLFKITIKPQSNCNIQQKDLTMKILVTGTTGKLGSKVIESLFKTIPASQRAVSVLNVEKAEGLRTRGVEVRQGDFDQPETLDHAFSWLLLMCDRSSHH